MLPKKSLRFDSIVQASKGDAGYWYYGGHSVWSTQHFIPFAGLKSCSTVVYSPVSVASPSQKVLPCIASLGLCHSMPNVQQPQWSARRFETNMLKLADFFVKAPTALCATPGSIDQRLVFTISLFGWAGHGQSLFEERFWMCRSRTGKGEDWSFSSFLKCFSTFAPNVLPKAIGSKEPTARSWNSFKRLRCVGHRMEDEQIYPNLAAAQWKAQAPWNKRGPHFKTW